MPTIRQATEERAMASDESLLRRSTRLGGIRLIMLILMSVVISLFLFPDILNRPKTYNLGDVAKEDIKASSDLLIENRELTEKNRAEAADAVPAVYNIDPDGSGMVSRIREAMTSARNVFFPSSRNVETAATAIDRTALEAAAQDQFFQMLEVSPDQKLFQELIKARFAIEIEKATSTLMTRILRKGIAGNTIVLMSQQQKGITLKDIQNQSEILITDLSRFYNIEGAKNFIAEQKKALKDQTDSTVYPSIVIDLATALIKPNVTANPKDTQLKKDLARNAVKPSFYQVKTGEMIVREGERIGPEHLVKLTAENKLLDGKSTLKRVPGMAALVAIFLAAIYVCGLVRYRTGADESRNLIFTGSTLLILFLFIWVYDFVAEEFVRGFHSLSYQSLLFGIPITCGSMLAVVFQGKRIALIVSLIISILASLLTQGGEEFFIYFFVSSILAAFWIRDYRERGVILKTGLKVSLVNILLAMIMEMDYGTFFSADTPVAMMAGLGGGLLAGIISTGIIPLVEMAFGFSTDIKLLELANLDQPLLRELMVQAPGTYHHSVIVSNMAEASAEAIEANPLLAKVASYYHDIGKMKKPHYFIENQAGKENKHDKLAPSMSVLIITSHVKEGVELAKEHRLNKEIIDIIGQHQGTKLISYFYQKAKDQASKGGKTIQVKEEDFRYPGPKPQTKEAGLVMLADMVEAATRSLTDHSSARVQGTVQRIINNVFADGQLDDCDLTLKDLHEIAKSFNITLSGIYHDRVEYPGSNPAIGKRLSNGDTNKISEEGTGSHHPDDKEDNEEALRRLGLR
jgi:cyclic-di-AMP phosphodiesterase PgpH